MSNPHLGTNIDCAIPKCFSQWLAGLLWQQTFCPEAKWLLKTDDDTAVHLPRLDHWIDHKFSPELSRNKAATFGWLISGVGPYREPGHKWLEGREIPGLFAGSHIPRLQRGNSSCAEAHPRVVGFNMDDVLFTGILTDLANVSRSDHRQIFRVGHQLHEKEECEKGWPYATAVYGGTFQEMYEKLEHIEC